MSRCHPCSTKRRLQRIAVSFNAKARRWHVPGVIHWTMLAGLDGPCNYCGIGLDLDHGSFDHVLPFDRGGDNQITNIVRCCMTCQRTKFTKSPAEFAEHRDMVVTCARPGCGVQWKPRWAERQRGMARYCSHQCAGSARA